MRISDVVNQLKAVIPRYTDDFSTVLSVTSLTRAGSTVTATTSSPHGLGNYKGVFANYTALITAYPTSNINDFGYVTATNTQWLWVGNNVNNWVDTTANNLAVKVLIDGAETPILLSSLTRINNYALAICATQHNLTLASTEVEITGATPSGYNGTFDLVWMPPAYAIESITIDTDTNIATVTTVEPHGFVVDPNFIVQILGTLQAAYNAKTTIASIPSSTTFTIANVYGANEDATQSPATLWQVQQVLNSYTFIYDVIDDTLTTPATGTIYQIYEYQTGYNGYKTVLSAPTTTTFTYSIDSQPLSPAQGIIYAKIAGNITGSISLERAVNFYITNYDPNSSKKWLVVTLGDRVFNKSNFNTTDAVTYNAEGDIIREQYTQDITVYIFLPCGSVSDELLYISTADTANDYFPAICHALLGFAPPSGLTEAIFSRMSPTSTGFVAFTGGYYIYQVTFQATNYINQDDAIAPADLSAFRIFDFEVLSNTDDETDVMDITGDVDQAL